MPDKKADTTVAHQVALAISRLDSLSILPCVAAQLFSKLMQSQFSVSAVADIIESDPALTVRILSLISKQGVSKAGERFSLRQGLDRLSEELVYNALFSVKTLQGLEHGENRKQLILHSLAVACCAKDISEITLPQMDSQLCYCAGLLHDIGKLALQEEMPKSFVQIIEEAKSQGTGTCSIERKHLGTDHTLLGKHLAQKWCLPDAIGLAIWLHHSDTVTIYQDMSEARIAAIVQLADSVARQAGIGQSGSFDSPQQIGPIVNVLGIDIEQIKQIRQNLPAKVRQKSQFLGLDLPNATARYADAAHTATAKLVQDNTKLANENYQLRTTSGHLDFIREFLLSINTSAGTLDIAENFAARWQKFYQTGMVCLYLVLTADPKTLEAVVVKELGQSKTTLLEVRSDTTAIPKTIENSFAVINANNYMDWLFEQLDVDFDISRTKLVPLLSNGRAIGAIAFELNWPGDENIPGENLRTTASIAAAVLDAAINRQRQEHFAERFVQLVSKSKVSQPQITAESSMSALAEMAAGAAHELNNPLSVISGRAQMLADAETDKEKKRIINLIKKNAFEMSQIIEDLMSFAEPPEPRPTEINIKQIIDESIQLTSQKTKTDNINAKIEVAQKDRKVFADSGQVVSAIANIVVNALESYEDEAGPIKVITEPAEGGLVKLIISDSGCGMNAETLQKATQPFFSAKPAGRNRGMGLAHAQRLIELNGGSLEITSEPGKGTTVTISLPCK